MTREELKTTLSVMVAGLKEAHHQALKLTDVILENFVEKPKPTAVDRLEDFFMEYGLTESNAKIATEICFGRVGILKDILAQRSSETDVY